MWKTEYEETQLIEKRLLSRGGGTMKGTISSAMWALLNNRQLYERFNSRLLASSPREPFCVEDDLGNRVCYNPHGFPAKQKPKRKRNLLQVLLGK
jgi:hypothetical protein